MSNMLSRIKKLLATKFARRGERGANCQPTRRRQFERLEDRAMLSATMGLMPFGSGGLGLDPRALEAGTFAPSPQLFTRFAGPAEWAERAPDPMHGGFHDRPATSSGLGDDPGKWDFGAGTAQLASSNTQPTSQAQSLSKPFSPVASNTATTVVVIVVTSGPTIVEYYTFVPVASPQQIVRAPWSSPPLSSALLSPKPETGGHPFEAPSGPSISAIHPLPLSAAFSGIPTAAQIVSHDYNAAALAPWGALDAAYQSYASQLLLVTTATSNERASLMAADDLSGRAGDAFDDFIRLNDFAIDDDELIPGQAVARERAAVDAVLQRLQDLDSLPSELGNADTGREDTGNANEGGPWIDGPFPAPLENVALAAAEGGMVLLQASGEANESAINLANVAADHLDLLSVRAGVETSIGFYQAVDVGSDDLSADNLPTANPTVEPARQARPDHRYSHDGDGETSRKAAAALGASTLVGALLWCVRRTQPDGDRAADSSDENNRRHGMAS